jgi:hypothetical protein
MAAFPNFRAWPDKKERVDMSDETAREIAERETGRATDDRRETPERRANRSGAGRRQNATPSTRRKPTKPTVGPVPTGGQEDDTAPSSSGDHSAADQRKFNRV